MQETLVYMSERGAVAYNTAKHILENGGSTDELKRVREELRAELAHLKKVEKQVGDGIRLLAVMLGRVEKRLVEG
jgi:beta-glucosidase/6-phospho-beta-glucosidase/beta-galactosidase